MAEQQKSGTREMEALRTVVRWIANHRLISALLVCALLFGISFVRAEYAKSDGDLSSPLQPGTIVESVYGIGTVMANRSYQIKSGITSTIYELYVKEGDFVKKGAKLLNIDQVVYNAPFDGTVTNLPYKVRENIFATLPILTLVDLNDRYVVVSLEQQGALRVKRGQKVKLSFDTIRQHNYDGVVMAVYSYDINYLARIDVASLPESVLPGMTADVAIATRQHDNVFTAPVAALEEGKILWIKRGHSLVKRVEVKKGIIDKALVEVESSDLQAGDQVLTRKQLSP